MAHLATPGAMRRQGAARLRAIAPSRGASTACAASTARAWSTDSRPSYRGSGVAPTHTTRRCGVRSSSKLRGTACRSCCARQAAAQRASEIAARPPGAAMLLTAADGDSSRMCWRSKQPDEGSRCVRLDGPGQANQIRRQMTLAKSLVWSRIARGYERLCGRQRRLALVTRRDEVEHRGR